MSDENADHRGIAEVGVLKLPPLPDSDVAFAFPKTPTFFGSHPGDMEWNNFALEYYDALKAINKTVSYWCRLILHNAERWSAAVECYEEVAYRAYLGEWRPGDDCASLMREVLAERPRRPGEGIVRGVHVSTARCAELDPLDRRNGDHFCYYYWLRVMISATRSYRELCLYYLGAGTVQNYVKTVEMEGKRSGGPSSDGRYLPAHRTALKLGLCLELNRLRLVCESPRICPLLPEAFEWQLEETARTMDYARGAGFVPRSLGLRRSPMIPYLYRAPPAAAAAAPRSDGEGGEGGAGFPDVSFAPLPFSVLEELLAGLCWRSNVAWFTKSYHRYSNLLLDKLALCYAGPLGEDVADDQLFRTRAGRYVKMSKERYVALLKTALQGESHRPARGGASALACDALPPASPVPAAPPLSPLSSLSSLSSISSSSSSSSSSDGGGDDDDDPVGTGGARGKEVGGMTVETTCGGGEGDDRDDEGGRSDEGATKEREIEGITSALAASLHCGRDAAVGACYLPSAAFLQYTSCVTYDLLLNAYYREKYPRRRWRPSARDREEFDFKCEYFSLLRSLFKAWFRHRLTSPNDMLRDTANEKYLACMATKAEVGWLAYYNKHVRERAGSARVVSSTVGKLLEALRPYENEDLLKVAGQPLDVMFGLHRADSAYRGFADWVRLLLAGSVFSKIAEFVGENSKYVLHQDQTLSNSAWFEQDGFPFMWYVGGRYNVYVDGQILYANEVPYDFVSHVVDRCGSEGLADLERRRGGRGRGKSLGEAYAERLERSLRDRPEKEARAPADAEGPSNEDLASAVAEDVRAVNAVSPFDDHAYVEHDLSELVRKLGDIVDVARYPFGSFESGGKPPDYACDPDGDGDADPGRGSLPPTVAEYVAVAEAGVTALESAARAGPSFAGAADDGDTLYDTLALWVMATLERSPPDSALPRILCGCIVDVCATLTEKYGGTDPRLDPSLKRAVPAVSKTWTFTRRFEEKYL
jgi:hypothetical protein